MKGRRITIGILSGTITIMLCLLLCIRLSCNSNDYEQPAKFKNIPKDAVWRGAQDEGFWIDIVSLDSVKRVLRIKIYNDYKGELVLDGDFKEVDCIITPFTQDNVLNNIFGFMAKSGSENYDEITMRKIDCSIKLIKPAYGGKFKE